MKPVPPLLDRFNCLSFLSALGCDSTTTLKSMMSHMILFIKRLADAARVEGGVDLDGGGEAEVEAVEDQRGGG